MQRRSFELQSATSPEAAPPVGRYYEVEGRRLLLHQSGSGGPAVVFLPGGGAVGLDYLNIQQRAAELTTSVTYDRAGTGWSDSVDLPRTSVEVTDELRALLNVAEVPAPYVMVGHSLGGLYARHYTQRFSGEVAGLVYSILHTRTTTRTCPRTWSTVDCLGSQRCVACGVARRTHPVLPPLVRARDD